MWEPVSFFLCRRVFPSSASPILNPFPFYSFWHNGGFVWAVEKTLMFSGSQWCLGHIHCAMSQQWRRVRAGRAICSWAQREQTCEQQSQKVFNGGAWLQTSVSRDCETNPSGYGLIIDRILIVAVNCTRFWLYTVCIVALTLRCSHCLTTAAIIRPVSALML